MAALAVLNPIPQFFDLDGMPLDDGFIYFGTVAQNPIIAPATVYWDAAATIPASQPIRTSNGFPMRSGTPAIIYSTTDISMLVQNKSGSQIFYAADSGDFGNSATSLAALTAYIAALADPSLPGNGDALVAVNTTGFATTQHKWNGGQFKNLVSDFGAVGDDATDNSTTIETAMAWMAANGGGTLYVPPGIYRHSLPIKHRDGIRFIGASKYDTVFKKTGAGTISIGAPANGDLVCLRTTGATAKMSDGAGNVNCSLWMDAPIRQVGSEIAYMQFTSTGTSVATSNTRLGIAGIGASETSIHDCDFQFFQLAGFVLPVFFASVFYNNHAFRCGKGFAIENGPALAYFSNYAIYCQWHGHYLRDVSYSSVKNNACDGLNNVSNAPDYTDRTVDSIAYVLDACRGIDFGPNGTEQCFGTQLLIDSCVDVDGPGMVGIGPCSSYTGANQVALVYIKSLAHSVTVNGRFERGGVTALQGAAVAGQHHDFYVNVASENQGFRFGQWKTCNTKYDVPSAIFGNTVPTYLRPLKQPSKFSGEFAPVLNMVSGTGVAITYGANNRGRFVVDDGWMTVDILLECTNVTYAGAAVFPELRGLPFDNASAKDARLIVDQSAGITWPTTESFWSDVLPVTKIGTFRNRTDAALLTCPAAFATGASIYMHITGVVYVGDVMNVV